MVLTRLLSEKYATHSPLDTVFNKTQLFNDDKVANIFEALVGTLRAAKKKKIISYDGELLLQGVHNQVSISTKNLQFLLLSRRW